MRLQRRYFCNLLDRVGIETFPESARNPSDLPLFYRPVRRHMRLELFSTSGWHSANIGK